MVVKRIMGSGNITILVRIGSMQPSYNFLGINLVVYIEIHIENKVSQNNIKWLSFKMNNAFCTDYYFNINIFILKRQTPIN